VCVCPPNDMDGLLHVDELVSQWLAAGWDKWQAFVCLTFLDRLRARGRTADLPWRLAASSLTPIELSFISAAYKPAKTCLSQVNVSLTIESDPEPTMKLQYANGDRLRLADIDRLLEALENITETAHVFDFGELVQNLIDMCRRAVVRARPTLFNHSDLSAIQIKRVIGFGEDWSAPFDIAFQVGQHGGNQLDYPDANEYTAAQRAEAASRLQHARRIRSNHVHRCFRAIPHEIIHCLQSRYHHVDSNRFNWGSEHDASFVAGTLLRVGASWARQDDDGDGCFIAAGVLEAVLVEWLDEMVHLCPLELDDELEASYLAWRDSFGHTAPRELRGVQATLFKDRIAWEHSSNDPEILGSQLDALFKDRTGDLYQYPPPPGDALYRRATRCFKVDTQPCSSDEIDQWIVGFRSIHSLEQ